jgi:Ion transport protein
MLVRMCMFLHVMIIQLCMHILTLLYAICSVFGIPIGVLGAGFEKVVEEENQENTEELQAAANRRLQRNVRVGTPSERAAYNFVNGDGSTAARYFELSIYVLIFLAVGVGVWQTVDGQENAFHQVEWAAVFVFTFEYLLRLYGAGADPEYANTDNWLLTRLRFMASFYSIVDLLAIVPMYIAYALPNSIVNRYDEYLRMFRIFRLVKLDKYVPSISLIDDVYRLKKKPLLVSFYAAVTLWILFAAILYDCEHKDRWNGIDPVPRYGCTDECSMLDRFQTYFDSMVYTGIHLTGDCKCCGVSGYVYRGAVCCPFASSMLSLY